ncbi:MAG: DUF748 domain-containing protein [Pseudomonadota bacterium]
MVSVQASIEFFRKNAKRILIIVPSLVILYAVTGFFIVPQVIITVVPEKISAAIGRPFGLKTVAFNPFTLSLHITGVTLGDHDGGEFASVGAITANAELVSLLTATPTLKSLVIQTPAARVVRNTNGSFNFSDLLKPGAVKTPESPAPVSLPAFFVRRLIVTDARLQWQDNAVTPAFSAAVTTLNLDAGELGTRSKRPGTFNAAMTTDLGVRIQADGEIHLAALSSRGHVQVAGMPLPPLAPYAEPYFKGRIDSGTVDLDFDYQYASGTTGMALPAVRQANFTLAGLRVSPPTNGSPLLDLQRLTVSDVNLEPAEFFLGVGAVTLAGARVDLVRHADGRIDLLDLVVPPPTAPSGSPPDGSPPDSRPWRIALTTLTASGVSGHITDRAAAAPATLAVGGLDMGLSGLLLTAGQGSGMPTVENAHLSASDVRLSSESGGAPLLSVPRFSVEGVRFVPDQKLVQVASVASSGGDIQATRDSDGRINLLSALIPTPPKDAGAGISPKTSPPVAAPDSTGKTPVDPDKAPPWVVQLESLAIENFKAVLRDHSTAMAPSTVVVGSIGAGVSGLTLTAGTLLPRMAEAHLALKNIRLSAGSAAADLVSINQLDVAGVRLDPDDSALTIDTVTTAGGDITAVRNPDGSIDLLNAVLPKSAPLPPVATGAITSQKSPSADPFAALPFVVKLKTAALSKFQIGFADKSLREDAQARVKDVSVQLDSLTTERNGKKGRMNLRVVGVRDGTLSADGDIAINPLAATLKIKSVGLSLIPGQPYYSENIHALVTKGKFDTDGTLTVTMKDRLHLQYTGEAAVNDFASVDKRNVKDLLSWKSLYLSGIDVSLMPLKVRLDEVALTDYFARLAVNADGSVNLKEVLAAEPGHPAPAAAAPESTPPKAATTAPEHPQSTSSIPDIRIAKVTLQGGRVDFSDNSIQPTFETKMLELGGTISGLSSESLARADVFLAGRLENQSPLKITGQINPLIEDQYTDIQIEFSDIELSPFSPYAGKYLGRQLDKGKLTLVLGYKISGKKLAGENKVYLDQFTLGESVASEDAINLPIDLAVALLKDPSGRIQIDLPVRGNLEDPEFSVGGVIFQLLLSTITKIITAPFAALGGMLGGGPELSYVDFNAGAYDLTPEATEKLQLLVTAMVARPAVNIEIQGQVNPESDSMSLRKKRLTDLVRAEKLRDLLKKNPSTPPETADTISAEEFAVYIKRVYDKTDIAKPRNPDGSLKTLPPDEMEKLVFTSIDITEADLRRLSMQRAETAKNFIQADERIDSERVFLREPDPTPETDDDGKPKERLSRVDFAIRK